MNSYQKLALNSGFVKSIVLIQELIQSNLDGHKYPPTVYVNKSIQAPSKIANDFQ